MAYGDIGTPLTDVTVKEGTCLNPYPIRVGPGVFAVFYQDSGVGLVVKTYSSDVDGAITGISTSDTVVDSYDVSEIHVLHISGTVYVVLYVGQNGYPYVTTVDIATDGTINDASITRHATRSTAVTKPHICWVRDNIYLLTYDRTSPAEGHIQTIEITSNGETITDKAWWAYYTGRVYFSCCLRISDPYVLIAHEDTIGYSHLFSVEISPLGAITEVKITPWQCDPMTGAPWVIKVGSQQYAFSCRGLNDDGFALSCSILDNGEITASWDSQSEFDTNTCQTNMIISLGGIYYGVCYIGFSNHWHLATFWIKPDGTVKWSPLDTLDTGWPTAAYARWCWVLNDIYVIAWENSDNDIIVTPIAIESYAVPANPGHEMFMGIGP